MVILKNHEIVFIEIPRTASRAMRLCLCKYFEGTWVPVTKEAGCHRTPCPEKYQEFRVLCGIRNPYARVYAYFQFQQEHYVLRNQTATTFRMYLERGGGESVCSLIQQAGVKVDTWIQFEKLPGSFLKVLKEFGTDRQALKDFGWVGEGVKMGRAWQRAYTPTIARKVWKMSEEDFDLGQYSKDSWRMR